MADSLLAGLAARKAELQADQITELSVPLWSNPTLRLRVKPVEHPIVQGIMARADKVKGRAAGEAALNANAAVLVAACVEVVIGDGDDEAVMELGSPLLVEALGLPEGSHATVVVRALMVRDADVLALGNAAMKHSGYGELEENFAGE